MSSSQIVIAGQQICEPINVLTNYCKKYPKTIKRFDQYACTSHEPKITEVLVNRTLILNSRIGNLGSREIKNFVNKSIDWSIINPNVSLIEANPLEDGGLYDHAAEIYRAFYSFNIKDGKISKVLYLYRPNFFQYLIVASKKLSTSSDYRSESTKCTKPKIC